MSTHPNAMLLCVLTPDQGSRKTARELYAEFGKDQEYDYSEGYLVIGGRDYSIEVMESDYEDGYQISANEGDIVLHLYLTYGYGETVTWGELVPMVEALNAWADANGEKFQFSYETRIGANYW
jgi:hypothetical protein